MSTALAPLVWEAPVLRTNRDLVRYEAEWAAAALVAAVLGIAVTVVVYICSVCNARSYNACLRAVQRYWTKGC
jgi:hypothetical protein